MYAIGFDQPGVAVVALTVLELERRIDIGACAQTQPGEQVHRRTAPVSIRTIGPRPETELFRGWALFSPFEPPI